MKFNLVNENTQKQRVFYINTADIEKAMLDAFRKSNRIKPSAAVSLDWDESSAEGVRGCRITVKEQSYSPSPGE